jgi:hypothetical protein
MLRDYIAKKPFLITSLERLIMSIANVATSLTSVAIVSNAKK